MLWLPHPVQATLRSPLVRLSPSATRFMCLPHDLMPIGTSVSSTGLPRVITWMPSKLRWPPFVQARTLSHNSWLSSSLFTHRHRHYHRGDPLGHISWPLFSFSFFSEDTVCFNFGVICVGIWVVSEFFYFYYIFLIFLSLHVIGFRLF